MINHRARRLRFPTLFALAAAGLNAVALASAAQPQEPQVAPQIKLGARAAAVRRALKVRPTVVIVPDAPSFVAAISRWSLAERFPILIDDSSDRAREDIARFVRAFEPRSVVRWSAGAEEALPDPAKPEELRHAIEHAMHRAWGARDDAELREVWKRSQFEPFGVVAASTSDPAWAGALAMAAGRGLPFVWVDSRPAPLGNIGGPEVARELNDQIMRGIEPLGLACDELGDTIDLVTLCFSTTTRIRQADAHLALTDLVGRAENGRRWAWTSIAPGTAPESVYRAMCGLFLEVKQAWLFDGYKEDFAPPYRLPAAGKVLHEAGLQISANTPPHGGVEHWRKRARGGVDFDLIHVNSSGNNSFFDLTPGRAYTGDIPMLNRPAMVHFIHSFSAQSPGDTATIAGRWLESGAYAYYGSMDEPYLGAFVPAQALATRLAAGAPLICAARQENDKPWKLNYFGDPLAMLGPAGPRHEEPLTLDAARDLNDEMREALAAKKLAAGATALIMQGRDDTVVKLARAAIQSKDMDAALARVAIFAAARASDTDLFLAVYAKLTPDVQRRPEVADLLWLMARDTLDSTADDALINQLRATVRDSSMVEDAAAIAPALKRIFGVEAVRSMYGVLQQRTTNDNIRAALREAGGRY